MGKESKETDFTKFSEIDLVNIINETERLSWRMNHDASHGRIEGDITNSLSELNLYKNQVVEEIKKRTGLESHEELVKYVQGKLEEQENIWNKNWEEISKEGTVFTKVKNGSSGGNSSYVFETVRSYLPVKGVFGPNQFVLARVHNNFGKFLLFDDREVPNLQILDANSLYFPKTSGVVRYNEQLEKRVKIDSKNKEWRDFTEGDSVFTHTGFNEVFETYGYFNLPSVERNRENEIIIARPHSRGRGDAFYEFTPKDLGAMTKTWTKPKFSNRSSSTTSFRFVDFYEDFK